MAADNKLELVIQVDAAGANGSTLRQFAPGGPSTTPPEAQKNAFTSSARRGAGLEAGKAFEKIAPGVSPGLRFSVLSESSVFSESSEEFSGPGSYMQSYWRGRTSAGGGSTPVTDGREGAKKMIFAKRSQ